MTVAALRDKNRDPDPDVVEALEEILAMAKRGELRDFALAGHLRGNRTFTSFSTHDMLSIIGMLSFLHHTVCAKQRALPDPGE